MRQAGLLHAELSGWVARLGHTDEVVVADCGLPVPRGVPVVDLAVTAGLPGLLQVLDVLLAELVVEGAVAAEEVRGRPVGVALGVRLPGLRFEPHEALKVRSAGARLVVRTGESTPYANVVLRCGVPF